MGSGLPPKVKFAVDEEQPVIHKTSTKNEGHSERIDHLTSSVPNVEALDHNLSSSQDNHNTSITPGS